MKQVENPKKGMVVMFGRPNGELTQARIVRVNKKSITLEQMTDRGTRKIHEKGTKWRVGHSMVYGCESSRSEGDILAEIRGCYCDLSPENLSCDGELPPHIVQRRARKLSDQLKSLFVELGREVSETEALLGPQVEEIDSRLRGIAAARKEGASW